jgi:nucleoside 2-deoxyribosyltransferase
MTNTPAKWIYLAAPLFTQAEINFNQKLAEKLAIEGYPIYLPQQECAGITDPEQIFAICIKGLMAAKVVVAVLDGADADSGSCFEIGYAWAKEIPIIGLRTDFRGSGDHLGLNLMLTHSCRQLVLTTLITKPNTDRITYVNLGEDIFPFLLEILPKIW